ncbi:MAG: phospho-sugar mutase [Lachnospiraceae bacterium]|nr:phospho-sugar mutase [Lachnospiraceae bacterium]
MDYKEIFSRWSELLPAGSSLKKDLETAAADPADIEDRFYKELSFGTAGLRGKLGAGTNRMNFYTVGRAAEGLAEYILECGKDAADKGVIIACDPRHFSREFSLMTAEIFASASIKTYIFPDMRPTPELAFMIRKLGAVSGVNITASHNPKEYNGFKAYWDDGCQVSSSVADGMTEKIFSLDYFDHRATDIVNRYACGNEPDISSYENIITLDASYDRMYLDRIEALAIHSGDDLDLSIPIVYTPLNGAGSIPFEQMLKDRGFDNFHIVPEQKDPDPDFTSVGYPNPESPAAFKLSEELGRKTGAELLMATDPDADRFAIEIRNENGDYIPLNGNQTGYILVSYILDGHRSAGTLPSNGAMIKSIVTSTLSTHIAEANGVRMFESLTGFKNICGQFPYLEENGLVYLFGYEESVGYAACPDIRDKDGISAGMLVAEAAAYYRKKGKTLSQVLDDIYEEYGFYSEDEPNLVLEGMEGAERIKRMMEFIRKYPPAEVAGRKVLEIIDYTDGYTPAAGPRIPSTNALRFFLEDKETKKPDTWFAVRPSGTEPKIKFYFYTKQDSREKASAVNEAIKKDIMSFIESVK